MRTLTPPSRSLRRRLPPPPLENGERLTSAEFLRRYEAMPEIQKAQLIEGIVHMPSPVRADQHGKPDGLLQTWLGTYAIENEGVDAYTNTTLVLAPRQHPAARRDPLQHSAPRRPCVVE